MTEEEIRQYVKSNSQVNKAYMRQVYEEIDSLKRIMEVEHLPFSNWFDSYVKYEVMLYAGFIDKEFLKSYANRLKFLSIAYLPFSNWFDSYVKYEGMLYAGFIDKEFLKSYANRLISIAVSHGSPAEQLLYTSAISFIQNTLVLLEEPTVDGQIVEKTQDEQPNSLTLNKSEDD